MTAELKIRLRAETGMRRLLEIEAAPADVRVERSAGITVETGVLVRGDGTRLAYRMRRKDGEPASVRPVLALPEGLDAAAAEDRAARYLSQWRTVMTALPRPDDGTVETLARRAEDALALARLLSHRNAGKTVEVYAHGGAVPAAALMMALERPYFSFLTAENPPPPRPGWPKWEALAK